MPHLGITKCQLVFHGANYITSITSNKGAMPLCVINWMQLGVSVRVQRPSARVSHVTLYCCVAAPPAKLTWRKSATGENHQGCKKLMLLYREFSLKTCTTSLRANAFVIISSGSLAGGWCRCIYIPSCILFFSLTIYVYSVSFFC